MSLFQCENCGCVENTALSCQGIRDVANWFDWTGIEERKGMLLCSACAPTLHSDKTPTEFGKWHGQFERKYLPMGMFRTARNGNIEHIETGEQDYKKYAMVEIKPSAKQKEWLTTDLLHSAPSAEFGVLKGKKYAQLEHPKGGSLTCVFCPKSINAVGVKKIDGKWHWDINA